MALAPVIGASNEESEGGAIVQRYMEAALAQKEALRGMQMEVSLEARLPRLEKHGKLQALRKISKLGLITYKALGLFRRQHW